MCDTNRNNGILSFIVSLKLAFCTISYVVWGHDKRSDRFRENFVFKLTRVHTHTRARALDSFVFPPDAPHLCVTSFSGARVFPSFTSTTQIVHVIARLSSTCRAKENETKNRHTVTWWWLLADTHATYWPGGCSTKWKRKKEDDEDEKKHRLWHETCSRHTTCRLKKGKFFRRFFFVLFCFPKSQID